MTKHGGTVMTDEQKLIIDAGDTDPAISATTGLNVDHIVDTIDWDSLRETNSDTIASLHRHICLVKELRDKYPDKLPADINNSFIGLSLSFKDLIEETIALGLDHADETKVHNAGGQSVTIATKFCEGLVADDDAAMLYFNIGSKYASIQDKNVSLISFGWVDLFTKLRIPLTELDATIKAGHSAISDEVTLVANGMTNH